MKGVNVLIGVLWFYLNIVNGNSQYWGPGAIANEVCRRYKDDSIINHISPDPLDTRITGEKLAKKGEFPHMVQLGYIKSNKTKYLCSGFIISKKYIITAANCVNGENTDQPQFVRAGVTDEHDVSNEQIRSIHNILALSYITLIRVEEDFNFNKFVSPVCIYTRDKDPDGPGIFTVLLITKYEALFGIYLRIGLSTSSLFLVRQEIINEIQDEDYLRKEIGENCNI
uniref:Serine protease Hayan-like n=1 Tax=Diabrotica virgifera virgifera TaxID=50390 RepID=A0A6P7GGC1_DIAVI